MWKPRNVPPSECDKVPEIHWKAVNYAHWHVEGKSVGVRRNIEHLASCWWWMMKSMNKGECWGFWRQHQRDSYLHSHSCIIAGKKGHLGVRRQTAPESLAHVLTHFFLNSPIRSHLRSLSSYSISLTQWLAQLFTTFWKRVTSLLQFFLCHSLF